MNPLKYNKETINNRMIRTAMNFWGIDKYENIDPVIKLLIESLSSAIYTLSDDVMNIENRILDKLAEILIPAAKTTALPSHAVMCVRPLDAEYALTRNAVVYYDGLSQNKKDKVSNMEFSPVCDLCLKKGEIRYLVHSGAFFAVKGQDKEVLSRSFWPDAAGKLWIGIEMDPHVQSLKDLSFYIDFPRTDNSKDYLRLLEFTKWSIDGQAIKMRQGLNSPDPVAVNPLIKTLNRYETMNLINRDIYNLYRSGFITLEDDIPITSAFYPPEFSGILNTSEELKSEFNIPLLWIKVQFPPAFLPAILEDISICLNAVPIVQKMLKSKNVPMDEFVNIVPLTLKENEYFLCVHSVLDSVNRIYSELPHEEGLEYQQGFYSVRHGGCERFDSRDAKDFLLRLADLLEEEAAMFSSVSKGKITNMTQEMLQLINRMKAATVGMDEEREISHYLIMDCPDPHEKIMAKYWVTNGVIGNGISAGTPLLAAAGTDISGAFLVTATTGGKRSLLSHEKIRLFRNTLTFRDRIVTNEDIANFCQTEYPDIITSVELKRGIAASKKPHEGLIRTIDIHLFINNEEQNSVNTDYLKQNLETKLKSRSPETFNYRIIIKKI